MGLSRLAKSAVAASRSQSWCWWWCWGWVGGGGDHHSNSDVIPRALIGGNPVASSRVYAATEPIRIGPPPFPALISHWMIIWSVTSGRREARHLIGWQAGLATFYGNTFDCRSLLRFFPNHPSSKAINPVESTIDREVRFSLIYFSCKVVCLFIVQAYILIYNLHWFNGRRNGYNRAGRLRGRRGCQMRPYRSGKRVDLLITI